MRAIQIEIAKLDCGLRDELERLAPGQIAFSEPEGLEGDTAVILGLITLGTVTVKALAKVLCSHIASKKHVRVKIRGIDVSGLSSGELTKLLYLLEKE